MKTQIKTKIGEILLVEFNEKKALPTFWLSPYKSRWIMMRGMM